MHSRTDGALSLCLFLFFSLPVSGQFADQYKPKLTRILFVLDGSGSMKEQMDNSTKFEISKKIIADYLDSLSINNAKVETAVRIFGHMYSPTVKNCKDSRLEIPFGKHTAASVKSKLDLITPTGWTAIAYSLEQAANDFPEDPSVKNAIVLITDGIETCGGDPCKVAQLFQEKKIAIKPFVIGLGMSEQAQVSFDCVGKYFDVVNTVSFDTAMSAIITQALNATTAQINLLNEFGRPNETDIEMSLYDSYSHELLYNFVHALNLQGVADTLRLNPAAKYDIVVHSIPSVTKKDVELIAGTHNIIGIDVHQGILKLTEFGTYRRLTPLQCIVHENGKNEILMVQDFNSERKYLTGLYDLEILTLPLTVIQDVSILQSAKKEISVESPGTLKLISTSDGIASVYVRQDAEIQRIYEFKNLSVKETLLLQPGKYTLIYLLDSQKSSSFTKSQDFEIISAITTSLNL